MNTYMVLARLFFLLTFILIHQVGWTQEDPKPGNIFGLYEVADQISQQSILEFWGYHDNDGGGVYDNTLKMRYYQPLSISDWKGTLRLDTSYVSTYGVNQPNQFAGQYSAGTTMLTIWGNPPDILQKWGGTLGARIIFPFGSSGQWAIGPQVATSYKPSTDSKSPLSDFSPLVRYMYGFSSSSTASSSNPTPLLRSLYLFPTVGINLSPSTQIRFWDENGMVYNTAGGGWFVPLDAMITQRLSKHTLIAIGASKQLIQTYQQYNWSIYGKLSMNF
jgi:hypothetical protein